MTVKLSKKYKQTKSNLIFFALIFLFPFALVACGISLDDNYTKCPVDLTNASIAKERLKNDIVAAITKNGTAANLNNLDISGVTNMVSLFSYDQYVNRADGFDADKIKNFNGNISDWDVSHVTNMRGMFSKAKYFNPDISDWDVRCVNDMSQMFSDADAFNQDISSWNVNSVTNMSQMFSNTTIFNQNVSNWSISSVTNMSQMFYGASAFDQKLDTWKKSLNSNANITNMFDLSPIGKGTGKNSIPCWYKSGVTTPNLSGCP